MVIGGAGEEEKGLTFLSSPLPSVLGEERRGERKPTDIIVEVTSCSYICYLRVDNSSDKLFLYFRAVLCQDV